MADETTTEAPEPTQADLEAMVKAAFPYDADPEQTQPPTEAKPPEPVAEPEKPKADPKVLAQFARREQQLRAQTAEIEKMKAELKAQHEQAAAKVKLASDIETLREEMQAGKPGAARKLFELLGGDPHTTLKTITMQAVSEKFGAPPTLDPKEIEARVVKAAQEEASKRVAELEERLQKAEYERVKSGFVAATAIQLAGEKAALYPNMLAEFDDAQQAADFIAAEIERHHKETNEVLQWEDVASRIDKALAPKAARFRVGAGQGPSPTPSAASPFEPARQGSEGATSQGPAAARNHAPSATLTQAKLSPAPAPRPSSDDYDMDEAFRRARAMLAGNG